MKSVNEMREFLGDTMKRVSDGSLDIDRAKTIALLASEITHTIRAEIQLASATEGAFNGTGFIDVDPAPPSVKRARIAREGK